MKFEFVMPSESFDIVLYDKTRHNANVRVYCWSNNICTVSFDDNSRYYKSWTTVSIDMLKQTMKYKNSTYRFSFADEETSKIYSKWFGKPCLKRKRSSSCSDSSSCSSSEDSRHSPSSKDNLSVPPTIILEKPLWGKLYYSTCYFEEKDVRVPGLSIIAPLKKNEIILRFTGDEISKEEYFNSDSRYLFQQTDGKKTRYFDGSDTSRHPAGLLNRHPIPALNNCKLSKRHDGHYYLVARFDFEKISESNPMFLCWNYNDMMCSAEYLPFYDSFDRFKSNPPFP